MQTGNSIKYSTHMYTVDNAIIHVFSVAYSDTNINNMDMDYEIETVWKFILFQIENKVIKVVRPTCMALTVHTCMYTNTEYTCIPSILPLDSHVLLPPFPRLT